MRHTSTATAADEWFCRPAEARWFTDTQAEPGAAVLAAEATLTAEEATLAVVADMPAAVADTGKTACQ
jgi:hypothetical protein